jgi:ketosteroid isomerase-like protein
LLDKSKNPVDTISNEVKEEADEHLFFFTPSNSDALSVTINDKDSKGRNLGLKTSWVTKKATNGTLKVKLMHQPGVKDGTSANGDTDVEIDFPLVIK